MQNGIPLNIETVSRFLEKYHFRDIRSLPTGTTMMPPEWVQGVDLFERARESVYIECRESSHDFPGVGRGMPYKLIISLNFTVCLRLTSIFSPPFISSRRPPLK